MQVEYICCVYNLSRNVDEFCAVVFVTLHVSFVDEATNTLLDHVGLGFEDLDGLHDFSHEILVEHLLVGLHLLDSVSINDLTTLAQYTFHVGFVVIFTLDFLLFFRGSR